MENEKLSTVVIVGGYGGMGKIFAEIFRNENYRVIITGPDKEKGKEIGKKLKVEYNKDNKIARIADITIITVPIEKTIEVIKEVAPIVKDNSLLIDLTSVKKNVCDALLEYTNKNAEILSIHPMFGPKIPSLSGQVFILIPLRTKSGIKKIQEILNKNKTKYIETTPEEHDTIMAVIQGLTHFVYITLGYTLKELNFDIKNSRKFASPIYNLMLDIIGRILGQDPWMYAHIQTENPKTIEVREKFIDLCIKTNEAIKNKDIDKFVKIMSSSAKHFSEVEEAMNRSNKAIAALSAELEYLERNKGKEIFVENMYTKTIHFGILTYLDATNLKLLKNKKEINLKISNLRILDEDEIEEKKKEIFGVKEKDFSLLLYEDIDESIIIEILNGIRKQAEIVDVKIKDIYRSEKFKDKKSVCYGVLFINRNLKEKEQYVVNLLKKIGNLR